MNIDNQTDWNVTLIQTQQSLYREITQESQNTDRAIGMIVINKKKIYI